MPRKPLASVNDQQKPRSLENVPGMGLANLLKQIFDRFPTLFPAQQHLNVAIWSVNE